MDLAEKERFELSNGFTRYTISSRAPSTKLGDFSTPLTCSSTNGSIAQFFKTVKQFSSVLRFFDLHNRTGKNAARAIHGKSPGRRPFYFRLTCMGYGRYRAKGSLSMVMNPAGAASTSGMRLTMVAQVWATVSGWSTWKRTSGSPWITKRH